LNEALQPTDPLVTFCKDVLSNHGQKWPPSEHVLAEAFVERFSLELIALPEVLKVCRGLGIEVTFAPLPFGLHGFNGEHKGKREIVIAEEEAWIGGKLHTLLHEVREILEYTFADLGYPTVPRRALENHAEEFASTVNMVGMQKVFVTLFMSALKIETTWKRWLAGAAIVILGVPMMLVSGMYPQFEDAMICARQEKGRVNPLGNQSLTSA
jgi:hypothetical protein